MKIIMSPMSVKYDQILNLHIVATYVPYYPLFTLNKYINRYVNFQCFISFHTESCRAVYVRQDAQ